MNEYMSPTQNNPKSSLSNVNMPSAAMPMQENKAPSAAMPMAETKISGQKPYLPPLMHMPSQGQQMPSSMQMTSMPRVPIGITPSSMMQPSDQPMQFGSPAMPSMPQSPQMGVGAQAPAVSMAGSQQGPPPVASIGYIPGFLASIIGRTIRAEFIIGDNSFVDRSGVLVDVGVNYFVLQDIGSRQYVMCDLYSVRFVTIQA